MASAAGKSESFLAGWQWLLKRVRYARAIKSKSFLACVAGEPYLVVTVMFIIMSQRLVAFSLSVLLMQLFLSS